MTEQQFLDLVYSNVKIGMSIQKPQKISKILNITAEGHIYYLIGNSNKKAVTRNDLIAVYQLLNVGSLTDKDIKEISGKARPCNTTTMHWILQEFNLATRLDNGNWACHW